MREKNYRFDDDSFTPLEPNSPIFQPSLDDLIEHLFELCVRSLHEDSLWCLNANLILSEAVYCNVIRDFRT